MGSDYIKNGFFQEIKTEIPKRQKESKSISQEKISKKRDIYSSFLSSTKGSQNIQERSQTLTETILSFFSQNPSFRNKNLLSKSSDNSSPSSSSSSSSSEEKRTNDNSDIYFSTYYGDSTRLRNSYYQALITTQTMLPTKEVKKDSDTNSIFIFDWDDTLFFTSYLNQKSTTHFSKLERKEIKLIETYVGEILNKALTNGIVYIITDSSEGWVQICSKFYYPSLRDLLKKIHIISSRERYQKKYPHNQGMWKMKTFADLEKVLGFSKNKSNNIICFGDNENEIRAGKKISSTFDNCIVKTIKFRKGPCLKELLKQLKLIDKEFLRVFSYPKNLEITVEKKKDF